MRRTRRHVRYQLSRPWDGVLDVVGDVTVERHDDARREIWVVSTMPAYPTEQLTLELPGRERRNMRVKVLESGPIVQLDGSIWHRLRLAIVE
jgi:hypothetical protein